MKSSLGWVIAGTFLGALLLGGYFAQRSEMKSLQRELAELRAGQRSQSAAPPVLTAVPLLQPPRVAPPPAGPVAAASVAAAAEVPAYASSQEEEQAKAKRWEEEASANQASVEVAFTTEAVDGAWAPGTQRELRQRLSGVLPPNATLGDVDCHSSICRVEVTHQNQAAFERFLQRVFTDANDRLWNGASMILQPPPVPDGTPALVVMYLGREGMPLIKL